MGRSNISEVGKRFTSEYQPKNRGRKKGSLNSRTILRLWLERSDPPTPEEKLQQILDAVFGKRRARRVRRRIKLPEKFNTSRHTRTETRPKAVMPDHLERNQQRAQT